MRFGGPSCFAFAVLALVACGNHGPATGVAVGNLCTTESCAQAPCAFGCVFVQAAGGSCTADYPTIVDSAIASSCANFCGLFANATADLGCRRFKSEDAACRTDCHLDGAESCYPMQVALDYGTGAAICDTVAGYFCKSAEPVDMSRGTCLDSGDWGP